VNKEFEKLVAQLVAQYNAVILDNASKCRAILLDIGRNEFNAEIRIFDAMLKDGYLADLKSAGSDVGLCAQRLVAKLQRDYFLAPEFASEFVALLCKSVGLTHAVPTAGTAPTASRRRRSSTTAAKTRVPKTKTPAATPSGQSVQEPGIEIEMVFVQGGTFAMGATPEQGNDAYANERPAHQVTLSDFYIGKHVVTQRQWEDVMNANPSEFRGKDLPVENVSWDDAQKFIAKLNARTGKNYRLPTEAEWEYAARGGSQSRGYKYSGSNNIDEVAWCGGNSGRTTHPVGKKKPNELGIYDMSGNVWEWCQDWYGPYNGEAQTDPTGAKTGQYRVYRGGSWISDAGRARVSNRNSAAPPAVATPISASAWPAVQDKASRARSAQSGVLSKEFCREAE
jgi:formylglycine-generating enzyme required for sulfatase activity